MPISKSAKKSLRVAQHKTSLNRYRKALIKEALKNVTAENASKAVSMIDKGVKWNLFHQNKAARMKSALTKSLPAGTKLAPKSSEKPEKKVKTQKAKVKSAAQKSKVTKS
jgi:small subunit ribosomal protein S20